MARIRTIKPEFFQHESLYELEVETGLPLRLSFAGLWCCADREGRFRWRPRQLKLHIDPYSEVDFSRVLDALTTRGFVRKYTVEGVEYGWIPGFHRHQVINNREAPSEIPPFPDDCACGPHESSASTTREPRVDDASTTRLVHAQGEGKGREGKGKEDASTTRRGSRLPDDWSLPDEYLTEALKVRPDWTADHARVVAQSFRDYWIAKPGQGGVKTDWLATWRNWCRNDRGRPVGTPPQPPGEPVRAARPRAIDNAPYLKVSRPGAQS